MDMSIIEANTVSRNRLEAFINRLSDTDLALPVGADWTVAAALMHLVFYDRRAIVMLERIAAGGPEESAIDVQMVNDAMLPLLLAAPPRDAARICLETARTVDRMIEQVTSEQVATVLRAGIRSEVNVDRGDHRNEHLDELERVVS